MHGFDYIYKLLFYCMLLHCNKTIDNSTICLLNETVKNTLYIVVYIHKIQKFCVYIELYNKLYIIYT